MICKSKTYQRVLILFVLFMSSQTLNASELCKKLVFAKNKIHIIRCTMYKHTYIELPDTIIGKPIIANDLWKARATGKHLVVQPTSEERQGKEATLTVIGENDVGESHTYHFKLINAKSKVDQCVVILRKKDSFNIDKSFFTESSSLLKDEVVRLNKDISSLKEELASLKSRQKEHIVDALKKYRSFIYTNYTWINGYGFKERGVVTDVFDDGRYTFIRVKDDNRGMMAISAKIEGRMEILEYKLDGKDIYQIVGIYPKITLKYGRSSVTITRKDSSSNSFF